MTRDDEDKVLANAEAITKKRNQEYLEKAEATKLRMESGKPPFKQGELTYAAGARCKCGAGYAYPEDSGMHGAWACSALLLSGDRSRDEAVKHDGALPFAMYEIKSENQPSAYGATTRPVDEGI